MNRTDYEAFSTQELRKACRCYIEGAGSRGGLAHIGRRFDLETALATASITIEQVKQANSGELVETEFKLEQEEVVQEQVDIVKAIQTIASGVVGKSAGMTDEERQMLQDLKAKVAELEARPPAVLEVKTEYATVKIEGRQHKAFQRVLQTCGAGVNCLLVGAAGSGKTTCAEKVAEALGLRFAALSVGEETSKSDLLGFVDASGVYHATPTVRDMFENGGVLLLDELDAGNANVVTILNSLLANGYCSFPDGMIKKHPDFRCIASANTFGRGADRMYVGRNALDAATLNRFVVKDFDYDEEMEMEIATNKDWCKKVQDYRHNAERLKLRIIISPRATFDGEKLIAAGIPEDEVEDMAIFKGCDEGMKSKIKFGY